MKDSKKHFAAMIIGLLILVIVAAVVIRTFLSSMNGIDKYPIEESVYKEFKLKCLSFCREYSISRKLDSAVAFCTKRIFPEGTKNKIGKPTEVDVIPPKATENFGELLLQPTEVCEDAIFCFHLFNCSEYITITIEDCRKILCEYYSEKYKDPSTERIDYVALDNKIRIALQGRAKNPYGSCKLDSDNWWTRYFYDQVNGSICLGIV